MDSNIVLIPIDLDGRPRGYTGSLSPTAREMLQMAAHMYNDMGFEEPWIGYLAVANETVVGTCGFKGLPHAGRVEIAYFTFDGFEGRGCATAMAGRLVRMAQSHRSRPTVIAHTLPQRGPSHRILEKLGFRHTETLQDTEDGTVWQWQLDSSAQNKPSGGGKN